MARVLTYFSRNANDTGRILLEMNEDQAAALTEVLAHVGGAASETRRRHIDEIFLALRRAGFNYFNRDITGGVYFTSEDKLYEPNVRRAD